LDPIAGFSGHVNVEKSRGSFILKVGFIDTDREKATQIVNTLVSIYLDEANSHLRNLKTGAAAVLSRETLPAMRQKVDDALELLPGQQESLEAELARERRELREDHPTILQLQDQLKRVQAKVQQAIRGLLHSFETDLTGAEKEEKFATEEQTRLEKQMADIS